MKNRIIVVLSSLSGLVLITGLGFILFSPYGSHAGLPYKAVKESIDIHTSAENVYRYMGNSANATEWSVYVDHITPLNSQKFPDGMVGGKRRCFTSREETGPTWDETILIAEPGKRRRLNCYNLKNFPLSASHLLTEQLYEKTGKNSCRLSLTLFFDGNESFFDRFKMYFAAYKVASIFRGNLKNIKRLSEKQIVANKN